MFGKKLAASDYRIYTVSDDAISTLLQLSNDDIHCIDLDENLLSLCGVAAHLLFNYSQVKMPKALFNKSVEAIKILHSYMLKYEATSLTEELFLNNLLKNPLENRSSLQMFFTKLPINRW